LSESGIHFGLQLRKPGIYFRFQPTHVAFQLSQFRSNEILQELAYGLNHV
jgi:hypothetical protein